MKQVYKAGSVIVIFTLLCVFAGCSGGQEAAPAETAAMSLAAATESAGTPTATPAPAPIATTAPDIEPTAEATATPAMTPAATPEPDDGRVTITEGFYYIELNDKIKERITGVSYPSDDSDSKIHYGDLRYIRLRYYDFEGDSHDDGEIIVNKRYAKEVTKIFYKLYQEKYPFTSIRLVDDFGQPGDDTLSMEANNTSAFCYRKVTGSKNLSQHSYGAAIDINPLYNPYFDGDRIAPESAAMYADRTLGLPGMIGHDDLCYKLFTQNGWSWGGEWGEPDYQHFSKKIG